MDFLKERKKVFNKTKKYMQAVGTYKPEFDVVIQRYADMRIQFDVFTEQWFDEGCVITEAYTNKGGATNERKTSLYSILEKLRGELTNLESLFGLTPKGLKEIKKKGLEQKTESAMDKFLNGK